MAVLILTMAVLGAMALVVAPRPAEKLDVIPVRVDEARHPATD